MEKIESDIIDILGYFAIPVEIDGIKFWRILDSNNESVGFLNYNESKGIYNLRINAPAIWLDTKRRKDSKKIKCKYEIRGKTKGKVKIRV